MPGGLKAMAPPQNCLLGGAARHRRFPRDEIGGGGKKMDLAPAKTSNPDPLLMLKKRLRVEMEALQSIVRRAQLLASSKTVDNKGSRPAPRRGKDGRFLAAEDRSEVTEEQRTTSAKRRKKMCMPTEQIVEPKLSKDEIASVSSRVAALSPNMPPHILEFLKKECTGHVDENAGEIAIDLGSMRRSAMLELLKLLDEFAEEETRRHQNEASMSVSEPIGHLSPCEAEEGEIVDDDSYDTIDICGDTPPVAAGNVHCAQPDVLEDGEIAEEENVTCYDGATVETEKVAEIRHSPSSSSSSSCSGSSSSSSSSSGSSSSSDSSGSDSSDSDSDDESVTSSPAPAVVALTDASRIAVTQKIEEKQERDGETKAKEKRRMLERKTAYEELQEMERNAKPISDWIHPMHLRQLGIIPVEYAVTSERRVPGRGCPVQKLLGLYLKAE